jgi:RNA polymerase sigma factor (sigma-70 family)
MVEQSAQNRRKEEQRALQDLVEQARDGDGRALARLCETIAGGVFFHAARLVRRREDAEDVLQEVLLRVCERIESLQDPRAFPAWLGQITVNKAFELYKQNRTGAALDLADYEELFREENEDLLPQSYVENDELRSYVLDLIDTLPTRQRQAVVLRYYRDMSVGEAAEAMGLSRPTASQYLKLARDNLRKMMKISGTRAGIPTPV